MIPNIITMIRFIAIFPLSYWVYTSGISSTWQLVCFILIAATDFLDGYIARKYNMITAFGKLFDPFVDRTLIMMTTFVLIVLNIMPLYSLFIYIRDIVITVNGWILMTIQKRVIPATIYGKVKTTFHFMAIAFILLLGKWNIYSFVLLTIGFLTMIPELIFIYTKHIKEANL